MTARQRTHSNASGDTALTSRSGARLLDYETFHAKMDGDGEFIHQVLRAFAQDAPPKLAALRLAVAGGNLDQAGRIAHSLKGIAGAVCAHTIHEIGKDVEQRARDGDAEGLARLLDALDEAMRGTLGAIGAKLAGPKAGDETGKP